MRTYHNAVTAEERESQRRANVKRHREGYFTNAERRAAATLRQRKARGGPLTEAQEAFIKACPEA